MKCFTFSGDASLLESIPKDISIKKSIVTKIRWQTYLIISIEKNEDTLESYINLKYGESLVTNLFKDFSPIPGVDYMPKLPNNQTI